ncbi:MAG: hypothetical protein IPP57_25270 [Candidatus Obscuribacter sp.]|nr:hypothetical protein [Candidatus Obscuribacter sp.]
MVWLVTTKRHSQTLASVFNHLRLDQSFCIASDGKISFDNSLSKVKNVQNFHQQEQELLKVYEQYLGDEKGVSTPSHFQ